MERLSRSFLSKEGCSKPRSYSPS